MTLNSTIDNPIQIDVSQIPDETKYYIGSATYDFITRLLSQPEMKEKLESRIKSKQNTKTERRTSICEQQLHPLQA